MKEKDFFKTYWPVILFIIPYIFAVLYYMFIGEANETTQQTQTYSFGYALKKAIDSQFALFLAFLITLWNCYHIYQKKQRQLMSVLVERSDGILNKAKIVFETGINEYDDTHLLALQRILNATNSKNDKSISIFAIDNSNPRTWWSDTMTGYLALLSKWKSFNESKNRSVNRIFVCQKNELLSPIFVKTISLHSLMGFKTYIIVDYMYKKVIEDLRKKNAGIEYPEKEVFLWGEVEEEKKTIKPFEISFKLDKLGNSKTWNSVKCYQSFWNIGSDHNYRESISHKSKIERQSVDIENFYKSKINSSRIDIWFEFIAKEKKGVDKERKWNELPLAYITIIQELISKMKCCKDINDVKNISGLDTFGIEVKCSSCLNCENVSKCDNYIDDKGNFDYTSASDTKEILREYYNKLN